MNRISKSPTFSKYEHRIKEIHLHVKKGQLAALFCVIPRKSKKTLSILFDE